MKKNVFSRTLAVLASAAVLGAASMISASAAGEAISLGNVTGQPGETVSLPVIVSANDDCNSFDLLVAWDDAALTGTAATFSGCNGDSVLGDQMVSVVGYTSSKMTDGTVASIDFTIPEDAENGTVYDVAISSLNSFSTVTDGDIADVAVAGGTITVEVPEETTEEETTEAPEETTAAVEETTEAATTAATTVKKTTTGSPKTGTAGVAVAVAGLVTAGATAVVLKKRH
ncbi:MAG: NPXTG-anchored protein [Oscillospiraceae bacterium]|nr:NPXTG-anchored protein [Oscillospiraceae bacterium]MDE6103369.1 NPXTG-anchored protein [Oscillospiraceae bacterium]